MPSRTNKLAKHPLWITAGIIFFLLIVPILFRVFLVGVPPGYESYYHHRIAEDILAYGFTSYDVFVEERPNFITPFHLLLSGFQFVFGDASFLIVPLLFGLCNIILLYFLLPKLGFRKLTQSIILLLYASSPVFLWSSWFLTPFSLLLFFQLLGTLFFINKKHNWWSVVFYGAASLFGAIHLVINSLFVLFWNYSKQTKKQVFYTILGVNGGLFLFYHLPQIIFSYGKTLFVEKPLLARFFTDVGAVNGFSIFLIILAIVGLILIRKEKRIPIFYLGSLLLVTHSYFSTSSRIYANLLFCILGGISLHYFVIRSWNLQPIRNLFLLLVIFGLLFSSLSFISSALSYPPNQGIYEGFGRLQSLPEDTLVFSLPDYGYWIQDIGGKRAFLDNHPVSFRSFSDKFEDMETILSSYDLEDTKALLGKNDISHILFIKGDKEGGLRFLLENNETFKKTYDSFDVTLWEFLE